MTTAELLAIRQTAGAAYAQAVSAYVAAFAELAACDAAIPNRATMSGAGAPTFRSYPEVLAHSEFLSPNAVAALTSQNMVGPIVRTRTDQLVRNLESS